MSQGVMEGTEDKSRKSAHALLLKLVEGMGGTGLLVALPMEKLRKRK